MTPEISNKETPEAKRLRLKREILSWKRKLNKDQNNPIILFQIGFLYNELGEYDDFVMAIKYLEKCVNISPTVKAYQQLGYALSEIGQFYESMFAFDSALSIEPDNPETHNFKGFILSQWGENEKSILEYREALKIDDNYNDARLNLAFMLDEIGWHKYAIKEYDKIISRNPHDCCAYFNKGCSLSEIGKFKEAVAEFSTSIDLRPDDACTHFNKGYAHYRLNELKKALNEFEMAISLDDKYEDAHYFRAIVLEEECRFLDAIIEYTFVLQARPSDYSLYLSRGKSYYYIGRYYEAYADFQHVLVNNDDILGKSDYIRIARCQYELKDYDDAIKTLNPIFDAGSFESIRTRNRMFIVTKLLGDIYYDKGEDDIAKKYYYLFLNECEKNHDSNYNYNSEIREIQNKCSRQSRRVSEHSPYY